MEGVAPAHGVFGLCIAGIYPAVALGTCLFVAAHGVVHIVDDHVAVVVALEGCHIEVAYRSAFNQTALDVANGGYVKHVLFGDNAGGNFYRTEKFHDLVAVERVGEV